MNRKLFFLGIALTVFALSMRGALGQQAYQFTVVPGSVAGGTSFNAVANNGNIFVCVGGVNVPIVTANANKFTGYAANFASTNALGGYLLSSVAWTNTLKNASTNRDYSLNCVAMTQPGGFIAAGAANAIFTSSDGVTWTQKADVSSDGTIYIAGIAYNQLSGNYSAAASRAAYYSPSSLGSWTQCGGFTFAESLRGVTSFANSNLVSCGVLGDIRISSDGGASWGVGQTYNINFPTLFSAASDGNANSVCGGDFSGLEVSMNRGTNWTFQNKFNVGATYPTGSGGETNFNAVAYSPTKNQFLAAGTVDTASGLYGLILMAPNTNNSAVTNWAWSPPATVWADENGELAATNIAALSGAIINGASFANSNFFQGIVLLAATNGTIIVGGVPPPAPSGPTDATNCAGNGEFGMCGNPPIGVTVNGNSFNPTNDIAIDWSSNPTNWTSAFAASANSVTPGFTSAGGGFLASFIPTNASPGTYYYYARERDLRTGFTSSVVTNTFVVKVLPQWISSGELSTNAILTTPQTNVVIQDPGVANIPEITTDDPGATVVYDWYTNPDPTNSYDNPNAQNAYGEGPGGIVVKVLGGTPFIPTNRVCGAYTYYVRARIVDPNFPSSCTCQSTNMIPVTFNLLPAVPADASVGITNVLTGAPNTPIWVDVVTNADNLASSFSVNWFSDANSVNIINNSTAIVGNRFFQTPTNKLCGIFTNWAETEATGPALISTGRIPVVFYIIPAPPTSPVNATNCPNASPNPQVSVSVPAGQTVNWYSVPTGGTPLATGLAFTPAETSPGIYTNWAEAKDIASGLVSTNRTAVIFQVNQPPLPPTNAVTQTSVLTAPLQTNATLTVSVTNSIFVGNPVTVDWYTDSGGLNIAYTATNNSDPNWASGGGVVPATGTLNFIPTNRICGTYTYYARARVLNPACGCLDCVSPTLTPVTFVLLPPAPVSESTDVTNVLTGSDASNLPVWVEVLTNSDNSWSNFVVNWYTNSTGSNNLNYLNNSSAHNSNNQFFLTPTNVSCGVYTIWAETMATNTSTGVPMVSPSRLPVTFVVIPAAPVAVGSLDATNCTEVPNPTFTVSVTNNQTAAWVAAGGALATNALSFTPTNSSAGTFTYSVQAVDTNWNLYSTGSITATLTLSDCSSPLTINVNAATGIGTVQWPGNLVLLSSTNLVNWSIVSTGSMFLTPNTLSWTNTNPPVQFFRLTK